MYFISNLKSKKVHFFSPKLVNPLTRFLEQTGSFGSLTDHLLDLLKVQCSKCIFPYKL